jgi:hypothetical protein
MPNLSAKADPASKAWGCVAGPKGARRLTVGFAGGGAVCGGEAGHCWRTLEGFCMACTLFGSFLGISCLPFDLLEGCIDLSGN